MPRPNPLDTYLDEPIVVTGDRVVPNKHPLLSDFPYRLAIVGEAPGADEVRSGEPFVGMSGRFLTSLLSRAGIVRDACFIGNICQHRPPSNDISAFSRSGEQITAGLAQLSLDLNQFSPNLCLLLGKTALWAAKDTDKISDWRGSVFVGDRPGPFLGRKCLASYHPAACLRQYDWTPQLMFDIKKARVEAERAEHTVPVRDLAMPVDAAECCAWLDMTRANHVPVAIDIEGYVDAMRCISVAPAADRAFIVPFTRLGGSSFWSEDDEWHIWRSLAALLSDPTVPKILQNSLYDRFVLQYSYGIVVRGVVDDTMLKHWELYCELEKSLGFQCSIYTSEPYYKFERKADDETTFYRYCCKDSCVTHEISGKLNRWLDASAVRHYRFNMSLLNCLLYMELRGIRYDVAKAADRLDDVNRHLWSLQADLDAEAGRYDIQFKQYQLYTKEELQEVLIGIMCHKRSPGTFLKAYEDVAPRAFDIARRWPDVAKHEVGFIGESSGLGLNIRGKNFKPFIYDTLSCPKQYDPRSDSLTTDYEALLKIYKKTGHAVVKLALEIGDLRTRAQMLGIGADRDGRIRCGYNIVGTETGRLTCYTSPTGSGYNLQTIPSENPLKAVDHPLRRGMRDLFCADPGCYLFQCDLSGADGWTVAARLASLGDPTMLDDYRAGIKPAKVLCYMLRHGAASLHQKSREDVRALTAEVSKDSWDYFACKIGQHMTSYRGGARKLADVILIQSEGAVVMSEREVKDLQNLFFIRYRVKLWWDWMERFLAKQPYPPKLTSASGHTRRFFGRREEIVGEALAHEPQANTTYATNLAAYKLWTDPDNRVDTRSMDGGLQATSFPQGSAVLRIEPLHQVHDALLGQFRVAATAWAVAKIQSYFANKIVIAGVPIIIPFDGAYGPSWGELSSGKI